MVRRLQGSLRSESGGGMTRQTHRPTAPSGKASLLCEAGRVVVDISDHDGDGRGRRPPSWPAMSVAWITTS